MPESSPPVRVLQVVGAMNRGGIETWLMNVARALDPADVELTFLMHSATESDYQAEILELGHRVVVCERPGRPLRYARTLWRILHERGPFTAVHSSVSNFSALPLLVATMARVPVRVAHSQTDRRRADQEAGLRRRAYLALTRNLILMTMTTGLGCTPEACLSLFGRKPEQDRRISWLPNAIDLAPFAEATPRLRDELGIAASTLLLGHVARFVPVKNHDFLIRIAAFAHAQARDVRLVLVGDGPGKPAIEDHVRQEGLDDVVTLLGVRSDIPDLLASFDVLMLPSLYEGAPISLLEAQASGLGSVVSDRVSRHSDVLPELVSRVPLSASAESWLEAAESMADARQEVSSAQARMANTPWDLAAVLATLTRLWAGRPVTEAAHEWRVSG